MIRLTIPVIRKMARTYPDDTIDEFYQRVCKAQLRNVVDEFAKNQDDFWEQVAREMQ